MLDLLKKFVSEDEGISSVEYALLLAFVGSTVAAAALALGGAVAGEMGEASTAIGTSIP
jgi:pilus assembly protein Flp/PilA